MRSFGIGRGRKFGWKEDRVPGTIAADLTGTSGADTLTGANGETNFITGLGGNDSLTGGNLEDLMFGGTENDTVRGLAGIDILRGDAGNDLLDGGTGDDHLRGGTGIDTFIGGAGFDRISFFDLAATQGVIADLRTGVIANDGFGNAETMSGIEGLGTGSPLADAFYGNNAANLILGNSGDTLMGFGGNDSIQSSGAPGQVDGGGGIDTLQLTQDDFGVLADESMEVDLAAGMILNDGFGNSVAATGFENLSASSTIASILHGDNGANTIEGWGTLSGRGGDDVLTDYVDYLEFATSSLLDGGDGNDTMSGSVGADTLNGGAGADAMDGGDDFDWASYAGASAGVLAYLYNASLNTGEAAGDSYVSIENIEGSAFDDDLRGNAVLNHLIGGGGHDLLVALGGADILDGGDGNDSMFGGTEGDLGVGGEGDDYLSGEASTDTLYGGDGHDVLHGGDGDDTLDGSAGTDHFNESGSGNNFIAGGDGFDTMTYVDMAFGVSISLLAQGNPQAVGGRTDTLTGIENLAGSAHNDSLRGDNDDNFLIGGVSGNDTLLGLGGDDVLSALAGNHEVNGGGGIDGFGINDLDSVLTVGVNFSLALGGAQSFELGSVTLTNIENLGGSRQDDTLAGNGKNNILAGTEGADLLTGAGGNDTLLGDGLVGVSLDGLYELPGEAIVLRDGAGSGDDTLSGGAGRDLLVGGSGRDQLTGGADGDYFELASLVAADADRIQDFVSGLDRIYLVSSVYGLATGVLKANQFVLGNAALDANDRVIYRADGRLFFDADGNGGGAQVLIAILNGAPPLVATDIVVT